MAINCKEISNQVNVTKNSRSLKEDGGRPRNSVDRNMSHSGGIITADTVKLNGTAHTLHNHESKINGLSDMNQKKVDQIKQAFASGKYKIASQKLVSNMASTDSLF